MVKELTGVLTEKGVFKADARKQIKAQAVAQYLGAFTKMENGRYAVEIASTEGMPIYLIVDAVVGLNTDFAKKAKATKATPTESVDVPNLFD